MTIVSSTAYPIGRLQFGEQEDDLAVRTVFMSLSPTLEVQRWQLTPAGDQAFPINAAMSVTSSVSNPGGDTTIWTDGTVLYFGAVAIGGGGGGTVTGSGTAGQLAYWSTASAITSEAALAYNDSTNVLTAGSIMRTGAGLVTAPSVSFTGDTGSGLYSIASGSVGLATTGVLRLSVSATALTSTVIGIFPASTAGASGYASVRLPHGAAPTTNLTNGDLWTTTSGLFARINGATVGPFTTGGATAPGGLTTQVQFNDGGSFGGDAGLTYDKTTNVLSITGAILNANGTSSAPTYSFTADAETGMYLVSVNKLGFAVDSLSLLEIDTTAMQSFVLGLFPASTTGAGGYASIRMPHGAAPTTNLTDGDVWTTTSGLFARINGVTVGPFGTGNGTVTGSGTTNQVSYWTSSSAVGGDAGMVYDATNDQLALAAGTASLPAYAIIGDLNTGIYGVGADNLGITTGGTLRFDVSTTALTSTLIGIFPASAAGAGGFASIRLPHGAAPDTNLTDGDLWTTTSGLFARINGVTVGPFGTGSGTVTGSGTTNQVSYWTSSSAIGGDAGMVYDATNDQLALAAGTASLPAYAIIGDLNTGIYGVGADNLGIATGGTLRFDVSTTALTSTVIGIFPASAAGAGGFASVRLPHGAAPTTNLTNGDVWTTTTGLFARINGATVGYGAGTVTGTGGATAIAIWSGTSSLTQNTAFSISGTALIASSSAANSTVQLTSSNSAATGNATTADINTSNSAGSQAMVRSYGPSHIGTIAGIGVGGAVGFGSIGGPTKLFYGQLDTVNTATVYFFSAGVNVMQYTDTAITINLPVSLTGDLTINGKLAGFTADVLIDSSTARTLSSVDYGRIIRFTSGSAITVTVPSTLPVGFTCTMVQDGAGQITVSAGAGATVQNVDSQFKSKAQNAALSLMSLVATKTTLAGATAA